MSVREFLEHCAGIVALLACLQGCGAISEWVAQCDGKWRGFEHQRSCAERLAAGSR